jgi:hypothetical protein
MEYPVAPAAVVKKSRRSIFPPSGCYFIFGQKIRQENEGKENKGSLGIRMVESLSWWLLDGRPQNLEGATRIPENQSKK